MTVRGAARPPNNSLSRRRSILNLWLMKQILIVAIILTAAGVSFAEDKAPAKQPVASLDTVVAADVSKKAGDPRGMSDEKDVTGLVDALQKKEQELQAAMDEIARLRAWIEKIREVSLSEQATMHYNMGCMYKLYKQYAKAEKEFLKALKIFPDDPNIHYNLGILYDDDLRDKEAARKHYSRFLELSPSEEDRAQVQEWLSSLQ